MLKVLKTCRVPEFNNPGLWKRDYRIAVTGFSRAGKTVFLTSLISHLLNHDARRFRLGSDVHIVNPEMRALRDRWEEFPYQENYRVLAGDEPDWPEKTRVPARCCVDFEFSHWRFAKARVTLYDLPGERFADCAMYRSSFRTWSNAQIQWLAGVDHRPREVDEFLNLTGRSVTRCPEAGQLIHSYKRALAALYADFHQFLAPSTFVLSRDGGLLYEDHEDDLRRQDFESVAARRLSGLPAAEFAPLPIRFIDQGGDLVREFARHYKKYRRTVVRPLFGTLARCDSMAVLVDLAYILQGGPPQYHDADEFLRQILLALKPGLKLHQLPGMAVPRRWTGSRPITRIAFAASQIDRFHDHDRSRVRTLLDRLVHRYFRTYRGARKQSFLLSAITSAVSDEHEDLLYRTLLEKTDGRRIAARPVRVARVPAWDDWPDDWDPQRDFKDDGGFPRHPPQMPRRRGAVPDHLGLEEVFRYLIRI
jgi:predicted YcjX-like family ATPase